MFLSKRILLVDHDDDLRIALCEQILATGDYDVSDTCSGKEALLRIDRHDLAIASFCLSDMSGHEFGNLVHQQKPDFPVLLLLDSIEQLQNPPPLFPHRILETLIRPLRMSHLMLCIKQCLKEEFLLESYPIPLAKGCLFSPSDRSLINSDQRRMHLTAKETAILKLLFERAPEPIPRDILLQKVWGYHIDVVTGTLETHISRLRQKLEAHQPGAALLIAEKKGYRLTLPQPES